MENVRQNERIDCFGNYYREEIFRIIVQNSQGYICYHCGEHDTRGIDRSSLSPIAFLRHIKIVY